MSIVGKTNDLCCQPYCHFQTSLNTIPHYVDKIIIIIIECKFLCEKVSGIKEHDSVSELLKHYV